MTELTPEQKERARVERTGDWPDPSWGPFHRHFANGAIHRDNGPECDQQGTRRRVYVFDADYLDEYDRFISERVWQEGYKAGSHDRGSIEFGDGDPATPNPYAKSTEEAPGAAAGGEPMTASVVTLTRREAQVVELLTDGLRPPQIAERLFLGESTVRNHVATACRKVGVVGQVELIQAIRAGAGRCTAETGVECWEDDEASQDVRCTRPAGHEPPHAGVVKWT
jgi:DNA-binding CsgD family transcriptional regulator